MSASPRPAGNTRAFLLAAGQGLRFRPVTERIPKPLLPYLNVPLARAHLSRLSHFGISEAGVNLHHLGHQIEQHLVDRPSELPKLVFFPEPEILGTAGALRNAGGFLSRGDFLLVNSDSAIEPDYERLLESHRASGRLATLLVVPNREPDRYTPLQSEGDRVTGFGREGDRKAGTPPLLYTGVSVLSPRLLGDIPPGTSSLVDLWKRLLERGEEIGWFEHDGPFADLGQPGDFLRASLEALAGGGPFPPCGGRFDEHSGVLSARPLGTADSGTDALRCVIGDAALGAGTRLRDTVVWSGTRIGDGASLERCLVAGGVVEANGRFENVLLWGAPGEHATATPLSGPAHGFHVRSPRR